MPRLANVDAVPVIILSLGRYNIDNVQLYTTSTLIIENTTKPSELQIRFKIVHVGISYRRKESRFAPNLRFMIMGVNIEIDFTAAH